MDTSNMCVFFRGIWPIGAILYLASNFLVRLPESLAIHNQIVDVVYSKQVFVQIAIYINILYNYLLYGIVENIQQVLYLFKSSNHVLLQQLKIPMVPTWQIIGNQYHFCLQGLYFIAFPPD